MGAKPSKIDVADHCLRPHQPHKCSDVDLRKLRALIRAGKLAPCYIPYEGEDWDKKGLEECPICFLAYPALNRSQCCCKEICTECFLQVKLPNGTRGGALCPFCKAELSVFFKGPKSTAEKEANRAEEQRILEATLRVRQAEELESLKRKLQRDSELSKAADCSSSSAAESSGVTQESSLPVEEERHSEKSSTLQSGEIDEDVLREVLASLDLSEYIPSHVVASSDADLEDELLQQAIRASLLEHEAPQNESGVPAAVHPQEVAFSPLAEGVNRGSDPFGDWRPTSSPGPLWVDQETNGSASSLRERGSERWDEVDLSAGYPNALGSSLASPPSTPATPAADSNAGSGDLRASSSGRQTSLTRHSSLRRRASHRTPASTPLGQLFQPPPQSEAGDEQKSAVSGALPPSSQTPRGVPGFNALSTMSSSTMEYLLLSGRDFDPVLDTSASQDILTTATNPIMRSEESLLADPENTAGAERVMAGHLVLTSAPDLVSFRSESTGLRPESLHTENSPQAQPAAAAGSGRTLTLPQSQGGDSLIRSDDSPGLARDQLDDSSDLLQDQNDDSPCILRDRNDESSSLDRPVLAGSSPPEDQNVDSAGEEVRVSGSSRALEGPFGSRQEICDETEEGFDLQEAAEAPPSTLCSSSRGSRDGEAEGEVEEAPQSSRHSSASSRTPSAASLDADPRPAAFLSGSPSADETDLLRGSSSQPLPSSVVFRDVCRRLSSSSGELIAALHTPRTAASEGLQSPLPAPPQHLKAFLSGGRSSSPFAGRPGSESRTPRDQQKGLSFADLVNAKRSGSRRHPSAKKAAVQERSFETGLDGGLRLSPLTVGMVLSTPVSEAGSSEQARKPTEAGTGHAGGRPESLEALPRKQSKGEIVYEEAGGSFRLALEESGGAAYLTNPDGSTQLVLLTVEQKKQVAAAQAPAEPDTYAAPSNPQDQEVQRRIKQNDDSIRRLFADLRSQAAKQANGSRKAATGEAAGDDFETRLRKADAAFSAALNKRALDTGILEAGRVDVRDENLQKLISAGDAALFGGRR